MNEVDSTAGIDDPTARWPANVVASIGDRRPTGTTALPLVVIKAAGLARSLIVTSPTRSAVALFTIVPFESVTSA